MLLGDDVFLILILAGGLCWRFAGLFCRSSLAL